MLEKRNLVGIWLLLFAVLGLLVPAEVAQAATYDATGRWMVAFAPTSPATPPSNLCLPIPPERFVATLAQSDDTFTLTELGGAQGSGTINGETYAYQITRANGSTSTVSLILASGDSGTGTATSSWSDGQGGTCSASGTVTVNRAIDAIFDVSGSWNVQVSADQLDTTLSNPACLPAPAKTLQAAIVQAGNTFLISFNDSPHLTGDIDGAMHTVASIQTGTQTAFSYTHFLLINADSGNGAMHWVNNTAGQVCTGSNTVTLTRAGVTPNPDATLSVLPMNLTVGQSRLLHMDHVTGTPSVSTSPETGVVSMSNAGGVTRILCEAPGQATVTVTDANGSAAAIVSCVAGVQPGASTEYPIADWIFTPGVTRVTQEHWQSDNAGGWANDGYRWSRSGASVSFLDRGTLSTLAGDEGMIYTIDDKGLTFHGEKGFDGQKEGVRHKAFYGFVNPPVLDPGAVEILPEHVALSNLTPPVPMLPPTVVDGHTATTTRIEYELDAAGQPIDGHWTVVKQDVTVAGAVDLLAEHPPEGLQDDPRFLEWRDAITDGGVLNRLTGVIRLHVTETRFRSGTNPPESGGGDIFLANGLGIVFERWNEGDGRSVGALMALDKGNGLISVTGQTIVARQFRIDAPAGTILEHPFVQTRVEHSQGSFAASPHVHETTGFYNETPNGNSALLTVYDRANDLESDSTRVVRLTHGAKGYERQVAVDVDVSTLPNPAVLVLTNDHLGRPVTFTVKDGSGTIIANTGVRVAPVQNGLCAFPLAQYQELSAQGQATFTLAPGQRCVEIWPKNPGDFIGGWYDATIPVGLVNVIAPNSGMQGLPFPLADAVTEVKLVVGRDVAPGHNRVTGKLTNGLQGLANAEILAYPVGGGEPYLFHTDETGAFTLDLPAGAYVFVFRHTGSGFVAQGYLTAIGATNLLSPTQGVGQHVFSDLLIGEVKLTPEFQITTATLSGTVTDATTARISGPVTVLVRSPNPTGFFAQTTTGTGGDFSVSLPLHEEFRIEFVARGNSMLYRGFVDAFGNVVADRNAQSPLTVHGNMTLNATLIDAMGVQTYPIVGKVTENNATTVIPVPGATVRAVSQADATRVFEAVTDAMGYYNLSVEAGSYRIEFFARGYVGGLASGQGTTVTLGGAGAAQNYLLGGTGAASLNLMVALTKESGSGGGDPNLPRITITGHVSGGAGALSNILVEFQPDWEQNTGSVDMVSVKTDAQGNYSASILPGLYRVMFRAVYWDNGAGHMVTVPGVLGDGGFSDGNGQVTETQEAIYLFTFATDDQVNAQLPSGTRVSGTVTNAAGQPVQGVKVEFQPDAAQEGAPNGPWMESITDAAGQYVVFVQPGAAYRVYFNTNYWDWQTQKQVKLSGLGGYSTDAAEHTLSGEASEAKIYTFTNEAEVHGRLSTGLTIQGMVTASDGETALADVLVRLQPEWDAESGGSGTWAETYTDSMGHYSFTAVPGKYRVEFLTSYWKWDTQEQKTLPGHLVGGFADGQGGVASDWTSAKLFRVGAATEINTRLPAGMTLSGSVALGDGTLAKGALVYVHTRDWTTAFHGKVDEQGNFAINVKPGLEYRVQVWPAYCEPGNTDATAGCGEGFVPFLGGNWVTPPDASWVTGWQSEDVSTRPVVVASGVGTTDPIPGSVMDQSDDHVVTTLRMDQSLTIAVMVDGGVQVQGRVVDGDNNGIAHAWVSSDFGDGPTDQYGYFTLNLPSASVATKARATFSVNVQPGGYEDPETHAWVPSGDFMGGVVSCDTAGVCRLSSDAAQAAAFGSDLASGVAWPFTNLGNGVTGLLVQASRGVTISGTVDNGSGGVGDVWVNAWSHESGVGGGAATGGSGEYAIRVATPAEGVTVWYEVSLWKEGYLAPEAKLVKVQAQGVVGVYAIDTSHAVDDTTGMYRPKAGELILGDERGSVPVNFTLSTGNTISGRVTDGSNNGLAWTWVDIHSQDGSRWYGANTDENGNYRVTVAPANNYVGVVWGWSGLYRTTYYKNAGKEDEATLIDASGSKSPENVDFLMNAGAKISGTIAGLGKDTKVRVNVWSESERVWGGTEVVGTGSGAVSFEVSGLAQAGDYRLDWQSDVEDVPSGYYGGVAGGGASGPKSWEKATLLSTLNGNVTGVAVDLAAVTSKTLKVKVTGLVAGAKVDANVWSEELSAGRWKQGTADSTGQALIELKGLDASGKDYRLFVGGPDGGFKTGNFKGEVGASDYPATLGSLVGWDRATLLDMSSDHYVSMQVGSGRKVTVKVSGLKSGQKAWVDAFSETTWSWGGGEVSYGNGTSDQVEIKGLEAAEDYRISIWGGQIQGGTYAGNGKAPGAWESAELVNVTSGDATIDLVVSSGKSIAGTVNGMKKAQWGWVDAWSNSTYSWGGNAVQAAGSGADAYTIAGVGSATDFKVTFSADGYMTQKKSDVNTSGGDVTGVDFTASTGGSIAGTITGLKAQEWVRVDVWSPATDAFVVGGATADANGSAAYTLSGVPDGTDYVVGVWRGYQGVFYATGGVTPVWDNHSKVSVVNAGATKGIDFNLTAAGNLFYTLSGTVSGLAADQVVEINAWSSTGGSRTSVTGNANYTLEGLPAGNYTVEVSSSGYVSQRTKSVTVSDNKVTASSWTSGWNDVGTVSINGNTTGLNVAMLTGYAIKGTVTSGGNAVSGAWVNAWSSGNSMGGGAVTNTKGEFTIKGLSNATYKVDVWTLEGTAGTDVTVNGANQTGVTLTVVKAAGIVQGTVTSGGSAAGGAMVIAYDASGVEKDRAVANGTTGVYKLEGLEPNQSYTVKAFSATKVKNADWSVTSGYATGSVTATSAGAALDLGLN
ncbi:MAG: hypothetical protein HQL98_02870 [Magnetococcales bacterium]|nr:hypothetical protein [Magnetococcales bacterium]